MVVTVRYELASSFDESGSPVLRQYSDCWRITSQTNPVPGRTNVPFRRRGRLHRTGGETENAKVARAANDLPLPIRRGTLGAHEGNPAGPCNRSCLRRVPAGARACASAVLKLVLTGRHAPSRVWKRTTPVDNRPVNGSARPIERPRSCAGREVRGVGDDVVHAVIREDHRRHPLTEVVREHCTPGL